MKRRRLFLPLLVAAACGFTTAALAGDGAIADAVRQAFGGDVKATRADGTAAQAGDVPTKQANGSVAYAAGGGVANPMTADLDADGYYITNAQGVRGINDGSDLNIYARGSGGRVMLGYDTGGGILPVAYAESTGLTMASGKAITGGTLTWTSWTPTGSWSSNVTYTGTRARIGNDLLARVKVTCSGDPGAGALTINLPSGLTIDTTAHASPAVSAAALGYGQGLDAGTLAYPLAVSYHSSDTLVVVNALTAGGTYAALSNASAATDVPFDWQSGDSLSVEFRVTCTGW